MYEIFEHTADFGIRVRAETPDALFTDAARGLFSMMVANLEEVRPVEEVSIQLEADDVEALLHDWLDELLYVFSTQRLALAEFRVHLEGEPPLYTRLTGIARGEPIDLRRHDIDAEVKAITWHALKVEQNAQGWLAEVIVDV